MAQIKIYGLGENLKPIKEALSDVIHQCVVEALQFPENKRAHMFIPLEDFFYPEGRTDAYIIIEIIMISGRTVETRKKLINLLFERISAQIGISTADIEICILENPAHNWDSEAKQEMRCSWIIVYKFRFRSQSCCCS